MADDLDLLAQTLNRLIEQERFSDAQAMLPEYTSALDRHLRHEGGEESLKRAITVFHLALAKARAARAHMSAQLGDANRARAYTGESSRSLSGWQILG
jgi:hypothetical protein